MNNVLVAYATKSGSTADVAHAIGEEIEKSGAQVDVLALGQVNDLTLYDAVVLGAPMLMGWHPGAVQFLGKNQKALSQTPVALFFTAMNLTHAGETSVEGVPIFVDENLAHAPKSEGYRSFKERHTSVLSYLRPVLEAAPSVKPMAVGFFGGRLDLRGLKLLQVLFITMVIRARPGEKRNWEAIREWAGSLPSTLRNA
jgi:menaquinone-dependent protoporphyrinogen oxidase